MTTITLPKVVGCTGALIANYAFQPATDPSLTVTLQTQDGQNYLLTLSERGCAQLFQVISNWRLSRDFLSEQESPEPTKRQ